MKKTNLFLVSSAIGFCITLCLGITSMASGQDRIVLPSSTVDPCLQAFTEAYNSDGISDPEATSITRTCMDMDLTQRNFFEQQADLLNGPLPPERFHSMADVMGFFRTCRETTTVICPGADHEDDPPAEPRRLVIECRGPACVNDPARGIINGIEGRGWNRDAVCVPPAEPFRIEETFAHIDGEGPSRIPSRTTVRIVYCLDPLNLAAPPIAEREARVDLTDILRRLDHLEHACGEGGMRGRSASWDTLCTRFDAVLIHTTQIINLTTSVAELNDELDALRAREDARWAADCGYSIEEWMAMSEETHLTHIRSGDCDSAAVATGNGWHLRFHLGVGFLLVGLTTPANIAAPHGIVYGELEALPSEHFGFYLRGMIGVGDLLDRIGQYNPDGTIGAEGVFGGSAGLTIRASEMIAVDLGAAASSGFNPGGQIGSSLHTWPWFHIGGEARLRVNPLPWLHLEATVGLGSTHSEVRRPNVDRFIGMDGFGWNLGLGAGGSF